MALQLILTVVAITMMLKYGLIVKLESSPESTQLTEKYLVPALLPPTSSDPRRFTDDLWEYVKHYETCYFVFSTASDFSAIQMLVRNQLKEECFLPRGLMERLIAKAVKRSTLKDIANIHCNRKLYSNYAALCYGRQMFRLISIPELNFIRLDVEGLHPLPVYKEISKLIEICVKECLGSLKFIAALPYGSCSDLEEGFTLLNLTSLRGVQRNTQIMVDKFRLDCAYINRMYSSWLINKKVFSSYDIFISHRWNNYDDQVIDGLCDAYGNHVVGPEKRAVKVFLDKATLNKGKQFQREYGKALVNSTILVPILSTAALQKVSDHNPEEEDNVLIEWMLALECMQDPIHSKMRGIYPLMISEWMADGSVGDLFAEGVLKRLPHMSPKASIKVAKTLLRENGINESSSLSDSTVHSIVKGISNYLGEKGWQGFSARKASDDIIDKLNEGMLKHTIHTHIKSMFHFIISWDRNQSPGPGRDRKVSKYQGE